MKKTRLVFYWLTLALLAFLFYAIGEVFYSTTLVDINGGGVQEGLGYMGLLIAPITFIFALGRMWLLKPLSQRSLLLDGLYVVISILIVVSCFVPQLWLGLVSCVFGGGLTVYEVVRGLARRGNKRFDFVEIDKKEWRTLGFFYSFNDKLLRWELFGDRLGLENFCKEIIVHAESPKHAELSSHTHLGPYQYLKIVTWSSPSINKDGVWGDVKDLKRLADALLLKLKSTQVNESFTLDQEYSKSNGATLMATVKEDGFDPASLDNH